ncbi:MAG: Ig-like domain-containing protein [Bacilli bacterium]
MDRKSKIFGIAIGLLLTVAPILHANNVKATQLPDGKGDVTFTYVPTNPAYIDFTAKVENGRTIIDITNKLGSATLDNAVIEGILAQAAGAGSTKFSIYSTMKISINPNGMYAKMQFKGNDNVSGRTTVSSIPILNDVAKKDLNFSFWPFDMKLVYRTSETAPWQYRMEKNPTFTGKTLKARLAGVLNVPEADILGLYNKLYRFESSADGIIDTHQFEFYSLNDGKSPVVLDANAGSYTTENLTLLGTELFELHYHNAVKVTSIVLDKEKLDMNINDIYELKSVVAPSNAPYQRVKYASSDDKIAYVDGNGKITALKGGTVTITATCENMTDTVTVTVKDTLPASDNLPSNVTDVITNSKGDNVGFDLNKPIDVEKSLFETAKNNKTNVDFNVVDKDKKLSYSWGFDGTMLENLEKFVKLNLELSVTKLAPELIKNDINSVVDMDKSLFVNFSYHGELPGKAHMKIYVGNLYKDGALVTLYYYNETSKKTEKMASDLVVKNGYVEFDITHCSTYVLTEQVKEVKPEVVNPGTGDMNIAAVLISGMFGLLGSIYAIKRFKRN